MVLQVIMVVQGGGSGDRGGDNASGANRIIANLPGVEKEEILYSEYLKLNGELDLINSLHNASMPPVTTGTG